MRPRTGSTESVSGLFTAAPPAEGMYGFVARRPAPIRSGDITDVADHHLIERDDGAVDQNLEDRIIAEVNRRRRRLTVHFRPVAAPRAHRRADGGAAVRAR